MSYINYDVIPTDIDQFGSVLECLTMYTRSPSKALYIRGIKNSNRFYVIKEIYNLRKIIVHIAYTTIVNIKYVRSHYLQGSKRDFDKNRINVVMHLSQINCILETDPEWIYIVTNHHYS